MNSFVKTILHEQQQLLTHFFNHLDLAQVDALINKLLSCTGGIYFSGVGKSGIIAKKIAATLTSTGTRAHYLAPLNSLHGDIGNLTSNDIVVLMSKSGETDELVRMVPYIRNKKAYPIAWVSDSNSRLEHACDMAVLLPVERELCPFDLAPTISAEVQLIFGDFVAIALMKKHNISLDSYAQNHPGGHIGRRVNLFVRDLMLTGDALPLASPENTLSDVLEEFTSKRCGCLLIVDKEKNLLGIFTDGDLRRSLQQVGPSILSQTMQQLMRPNPRFVDVKSMAFAAMKAMESDQKRPIMIMPVVENGKRLCGLIKLHDILQSGI